tara:strand:+ start:7291 stop:7632 length:342 start_codon:yes stop_codon:yes gene_type:complete
MAVPSVNIQIEKGTDFSSTFDVKKKDNSPLNLSLYNFSVKMRKHAEASGYVGFAATYGNTPANGNLTISLTDTQTGIITAGRYEYDVIITNLNNGTKTKIFSGQALVNSSAAA